ncbi:U32 family peptidase [Alkalibacter rhizosphaerae]|uniref:U32 family peptidase n=1 Tax=Alkalibacter rhizosphaerae TaxID=2815577 RepID=A0A974XHC0_9FIRM|nr:U32 family peptidase [Alkalibacter rhizosphaerae]QSX08675.1 U32 family peptidase [Alkalibacter rhizosphaerae]
MKLPEVLAPAGTLEALYAAVRAGADAVYIGAKQFNARQRGGNFSREDLEEATRHCHLHGVKLYGTVNILVKEEELEAAMALVDELYEIGLDGLIVQDLGLFSLIRDRYPDFPQHSSTQMFVHGSPGVGLLEELGFDRIVLARELTLEEIRAIKAKARAEIKIFCHGALCISYSGQCYMSSLIGGRSGNRGRCAQPCRKSYKLYDSQKQLVRKGPLISPKDLNTLDLLEEILQTGVDSLKIEGRLKNPEYVYTAVQAYRRGLDALAENRKDKTNIAIHEVFNRKFTQGYLTNAHPAGKDLLVGQEEQADRTLIGTIHKISGYRYGFRAEEDISKGDGILIAGSKSEFGETLSDLFDQQGKPVETVQKGSLGFVSLHRAPVMGDHIYKTSDGKQRQTIESSMREDLSNRRGFHWKVTLEANAFPVMELKMEDDRLEVTGETTVQEAKNAPLTKERILEQLGKLNNTPFKAESLQVEMEGSLFMPVSAINQLRRQAVEALEELVLSKYRRTKIEAKTWSPDPTATRSRKRENAQISLRINNLEMLKRALETSADEIVYDWDDPLDLNDVGTASQLTAEKGKRLRIALPKIIREGEVQVLKESLEKLVDLPIHGFLVGSYEGLEMVRNHHLSIETDDSLNVFNARTLDVLGSLGVELAYLSAELNQEELKDLIPTGNMKTGLVVQGRKELMLLQYGLDLPPNTGGYTLEDPKGYSFPVRIDGSGRTHVYNAKELCLIDEVPEMESLHKIRLDFLEKEDRMEEMVESYRKALTAPSSGNPAWFDEQKERWTKGHFNRGVL